MRDIFFLSFVFLLCYGCGVGGGCFEYDTKAGRYIEEVNKLNKNLRKHFTIVNHTNKIYTNNILFSLASVEKNGVWKLKWCSKPDGFQKINIIKPKEPINKNEKDRVLKLYFWEGGNTYSEQEDVFLLSLDGGKRKIFFGPYNFAYNVVWRRDDSDCTSHFVRFDMHPVLQEKDLTITIEKNGKITFDDPKIKETKKLRLSYDEYVNPNTLELVDCSKE